MKGRWKIQVLKRPQTTIYCFIGYFSILEVFESFKQMKEKMKNLWFWWKLEIRNHSKSGWLWVFFSSLDRFDSKRQQQFIGLFDPQCVNVNVAARRCIGEWLHSFSFSRFDFVSILYVSFTAQWTSIAQQFTVENSYRQNRAQQ